MIVKLCSWYTRSRWISFSRVRSVKFYFISEMLILGRCQYFSYNTDTILLSNNVTNRNVQCFFCCQMFKYARCFVSFSVTLSSNCFMLSLKVYTSLKTSHKERQRMEIHRFRAASGHVKSHVSLSSVFLFLIKLRKCAGQIII